MPKTVVSLIITGGPVFGTQGAAYEIEREDGDRIMAYAAAVYGTGPGGAQRTVPQIVEALAREFMAELTRKAETWERVQAARAAAAAVPPIPFDPAP